MELTTNDQYSPPPYTPAPPTPSFENPWAPPTPTSSLRIHFKSFCALETSARLSRGETPFCSPTGRDRAFEKLLRLSKGQEKIEWRIDSRWNPADDQWGEEKSWYEVNGWTGEEVGWKKRNGADGKREGDEEWVDEEGSETETEEGVRKKEEARKDSKDVGGSWRRLVGRFRAGEEQEGVENGDLERQGSAEEEAGRQRTRTRGRGNSCTHVENIEDAQRK